MPYYQEVLSRHYTVATSDANHRVLDIGAGTGNLAVRLVAADLEVVAVDYSRAMLQRLRQKLQGANDVRLTVIEANAERLSCLHDEQFNVVSTLLAFYDMERPRFALAEAVRLLRPGGSIVITEPKDRFDIELILAKCREHIADLQGAVRSWKHIWSE